MNILINGSNLCGGGGAQVANSLCCSLNNFEEHHFIVVLSRFLKQTADQINTYSNVTLIEYSYPPKDIKSFFTGRNAFLDNLVEAEHVNCVLTIFGPMKWQPKCPHLCGFALSQLLIPESPYFLRMNIVDLIKIKLRIMVWKYIFLRSADYFYTENPLITERLKKLFPDKNIYTITNYYNQLFDLPEKQKYHKLPDFDGWQILNVGSSGPHKNLSISIEIARVLHCHHFDEITNTNKKNFRFVFTINEHEMPPIPDELKIHFLFIGKVDISELPSIYEQCDIVFQPSLLECFTAVYPEAMRMVKPIVTTDLEFAKGLCGDAAVYYSATDANSAANQILYLINSDVARIQLVNNGFLELKKFDDYNQRINKILAICEDIAQ